MTTPTEHNEDADATSAMFDSLSTPRTMPTGWDLSSLTAAAQQRRNGSTRYFDHPSTGDIQVEETWVDPSQPGEKFPKPNTYPQHWDLSG